MADETLDVELSEAVKEAFYPALKSQLIKHLDESDSTLFEYIVLLISNKRTKTHIVNDLQAFFNDSAKEFTDWLWDFLKPYEKQEPAGGHTDGHKEAEKESSSSSSSSSSKRDEHSKRSKRDSVEKEKSEKRSERSDRDRRRSASPKEKRAKPSGQNAGASRLFGSALSKNADPSRESTRRKRDIVRSNGKEEESPEEDVPQNEENDKDVSIKVSKVVVKKRRTRSRSPPEDGEQEDAEDQPRERTRDRDRKDSVKDERRDGKGRDRERRSTRTTDTKSTKSEKKKVTPLFTITLDGAPPVKQLSQDKREIEEEEDDFIMGGGTRAVVSRVPELKPAVLPGLSLQNGNLPPEIQSILDEPMVGSSLGAPLGGPLVGAETIRCRFWPKCTKEDCPFHHPKEICPYFPACKFGPTCLFIHVVSERGRGRGKPAYRGFRGGYRGRGGHYVAGETEEASEYPPARGRGGYRGRVRGRGRGAANVTKVFDASGVVCHFDTFCSAISCPYSHPVREKQEQSFLSSSDLSEQSATPVVATQVVEATPVPATTSAPAVTPEPTPAVPLKAE